MMLQTGFGTTVTVFVHVVTQSAGKTRRRWLGRSFTSAFGRRNAGGRDQSEPRLDDEVRGKEANHSRKSVAPGSFRLVILAPHRRREERCEKWLGGGREPEGGQGSREADSRNPRFGRPACEWPDSDSGRHVEANEGRGSGWPKSGRHAATASLLR